MATRCGCSGASCSCYVQAGANITVSGAGSLASPYIITADTATLAELDTTSVDMHVTAGPNYIVSADVIVSPTAGNSLVSTASGLFVPTPVIPTFSNGNGIAPIVGGVIQACLSTDAGNEITFGADGCLYAPTPTAVVFTNGNGIAPIVGGVIAACLSTDAGNALTFGADGCLFTPSSAGTPTTISALDTATFDSVVTGGPAYVISGNVKLSTTAGNILTADGTGLLLTCADILTCAPGVTVTDTNSVNLTLAAQNVSADVILDPVATNILTIGAAGLLVDLTTGCGLSGNGTAASPLIVPSVAWPFACAETNGVDVYCDPGTGMLVTDPEKFQVDQMVAGPFVSVADINTVSAPGGGDVAVGPITNLVVTNPSPCRPMDIRVTLGHLHMNMRSNNAGRINVLVGTRIGAVGGIAFPVVNLNAHEQWMRDQNAAEADSTWDVPQITFMPNAFVLAAGAAATFSIQTFINVTNNDAGIVTSLNNLQTFIRVQGFNT